MLKCDEKLITDHKDILIGDFQNLLDFDKDKGLLPCALNFSSLPHPPRQPRADRRIWIIAVQLRLLPLHCFCTQTSLPFLIHLANPRQTDRSGLLPSNSDYSPCAAFVPKLPFPPRQLRADRHIRIIAIQLRLLPLRSFHTQTSLPFPIHLANPRQTNTSGLSPYNSDLLPLHRFHTQTSLPFLVQLTPTPKHKSHITNGNTPEVPRKNKKGCATSFNSQTCSLPSLPVHAEALTSTALPQLQ